MISNKSKEQIELLKLLASSDRKIVAENLNLNMKTLNSRIHNIRRKVIEIRWFLKEVEKLERVYPHIKRAMLPTKLDETE